VKFISAYLVHIIPRHIVICTFIRECSNIAAVQYDRTADIKLSILLSAISYTAVYCTVVHFLSLINKNIKSIAQWLLPYHILVWYSVHDSTSSCPPFKVLYIAAQNENVLVRYGS
jgi:hypothetical protein